MWLENFFYYAVELWLSVFQLIGYSIIRGSYVCEFFSFFYACLYGWNKRKYSVSVGYSYLEKIKNADIACR